MQIIAHRGLWRTVAEQNTLPALTGAFEHGFGIETDVRDYGGRLLISHNPPLGDECGLDALLEVISQYRLPFALNIKADGLANAVHAACVSMPNWFVFDMSVPDLLAQKLAGNPFFTRMSEIESEPVELKNATGVWLDSFWSCWFTPELLQELLKKKKVCVVSSELHGRGHQKQWDILKMFASSPDLMLCTDLPFEAAGFFGEHK